MVSCLALCTRIIPTCAGNTCDIPEETDADQDHPRLRGEYYRLFIFPFPVKGSSPPARGIRCSNALAAKDCRIIPACAGNTTRRVLYLCIGEDHPRLRGEYIIAHAASPECVRIIPACAGNTLSTATKEDIL